MMLGARTAAWAKSGGWINPYATDGLVAMWDGEWNVAGGVHDSSSRYWNDLSGNEYNLDCQYNRYTHGTFDDNSLVCGSGHGCQAYGIKSIPQNDNHHVEICVDFGSDLNYTNRMFPLFYGGGGVTTSAGVKSRMVVMIQQFDSYTRNGPFVSFPSAVNTNTNYWGSYRLPRKMVVSVNIIEQFVNEIKMKKSSTFEWGSTNYPRYIVIGGDSDTQGGDPSSGWSTILPTGARIHQIRVYSRHLSMQERLSNYAIDKARFGLT